ncbi:hypothetical protein SBOR_5722 [Sclerotinia borealis F-4128]|uniref:MYND-type domain-containing protein n=1 Tax=Sclerotinia borealis (strain F-4128) TaxID=1432307 RepID=W9CDG5_SCLBF|nr:hypothetical protein SBOR_5722 [Sclerotinia borealis F-4128]
MSIPSCSICSVCFVFQSPGLLCASCKSISYCSSKCQKLDWFLHKVLCKDFASLAPRPSDDHRLAFYFPLDSDKPKLQWVWRPRTRHPEGGENIIELPNVEVLLRARDHTETIQIKIPLDSRRSAEDHTLTIFCHRGYLSDGADLNQSVIYMIARNKWPWTGPLLVLREDHPDCYSTSSDVVSADFRVVIQFLKDRCKYQQEEIKDPESPQGIVLRCMGDVSLVQGIFSTAVLRISASDPIHELEPTNVSRQMELPLLIRKYPREGSRYHDLHEIWFENESGAALNLDIRPDSETWGKALPEWQKDPGTIMVMRQDRRDITMEQVSAIVEFLKCRAETMNKVVMDRLAREQFVRHTFTKECFEKFLFDVFIPALLDGSAGFIYRKLKSPYSN